MFDQIFKRPSAIKKHSEAPLLKERWSYIQYWVDNGAVLESTQRISQYLLIIIDYLKFYKIRKVNVNEIEKVAYKWASRTCPRYIKKENSNVAKDHFVRYAVGWFKLLGCLMLPEKPSLPFEEQLNQYMVHMRYEQGLSEVTMVGRICILQDFLKEIAKTCKYFNDITPLIVDKFLIKKHDVDKHSRRSAILCHSY